MRSIFFFASFVLISALNSAAQLNQYGAPVRWERYKVTRHDLSVLFPKLPTVNEEIDRCEMKQSDSYYAFAEGAVYELKIVRKLEGKQRGDCEGVVTKFNERTLEKRLLAVRDALKGPIEDKTDLLAMPARRFVGGTESRWIVSDMDRNKRWIELAVHHYANEKPDFDRFVKSVAFTAGDGKEIGSGAESTLGDLKPESVPDARSVMSTPASVSTDTKSVTPTPSPTPKINGSGSGYGDGTARNDNAPPVFSEVFRTISQPKARYTDAARNADTEGAVRVRITLLSTGGVGSVVVLSRLSHGLTEQAIAAARKIVFLPKRVNRVAVSVVVTREYTFTIY